MSELVFFTGTMDCGKSTLAAQVNHTHKSAGRSGLVFTRNDRAGSGILSSRLGLEVKAIEVTDETNFFDLCLEQLQTDDGLDYLVCDETQFYTREHINQLAHVVDDLDVDVFAFGIASDFRTDLFPGSSRLFELADRIQILQVEALCWCGRKATHNARTVNGRMITEGDQVLPGDTGENAAEVIGYEVLCRRHHMAGMTLNHPEN